jgi:hypothetical protein
MTNITVFDEDDSEFGLDEASISEPPPFTPTPEQAEAVQKIIGWFRDDDPKFYVLKGYAGTGKTYLMTYLARSGMTLYDDKTVLNYDQVNVKPSQICFTAPTNKAVKVLRNYLNDAGLQECPTRTIYSLLGLSLQANGEVKEIARPDEPVDLSGISSSSS